MYNNIISIISNRAVSDIAVVVIAILEGNTNTAWSYRSLALLTLVLVTSYQKE